MQAKHVALLVLAAAIAALFLSEMQTASSVDFVSSDPGVRGGAAGAGGPLAGLSSTQAAFFQAGAAEFAEEDGVAEGLGPRMNLDSCGGCHIQPALGGSSPHPLVGTPPLGNVPNPQVAFASKDGGVDYVPPFIREDGPVIEAIPDAAIAANQASQLAQKQALGISGKPNFAVAGRTITGMTNNNGNDGTIARFGWKAQNKSLLLFSGEAYNVEMGITNEVFQTERDETSACQLVTTPNDVTDTEATVATQTVSAVERFAFFMRFLAPPKPSPNMPGGSASIARGRDTF